jgi:hypothetical protein
MSCFPDLRTGAVSLFLIAAAATVCAESRALTKSGSQVTGQLTGRTPQTLAFTSSGPGQVRAVQDLRQIVFPAAPRRIATGGPPRRLIFWSGESLSGEIFSLCDRQLVFSLPDGHRGLIDSRGIEALWNPPGERNLVYEDFEQSPILWKSAAPMAVFDAAHGRAGGMSLLPTATRRTWEYALPTPLAAGRVELSLFDCGGVVPSEPWLLEFVFDAAETAPRIRIGLDAERKSYEVETSPQCPLSVQLLARHAGWRQFTLLTDESRVVLLIDNQVLASGPAATGKLSVIRLLRPAAPVARDEGTAMFQAWIDDIMIQIPSSHRRPRREQRTQDSVVLQNGDELFGKLRGMDAKTISLQGSFGDWQAPWSTADGVCFQRGSPAARPISGWIARLEFQSAPGTPVGEVDWLIGAIQAANEKALILDHPWLGMVTLDPAGIRRLEPWFLGSRWEIDAATSHLGDELREEFRDPVPIGPRLEREFTLDALPAGTAWMSLLTDNLEPAGPWTPAWSEFLGELRGGHLLTELYLNEQRIGDLNRHLDSRATASRPVRLRIPIPANVLKAGRNRVRLEQRPARDDPRDFDDCEISNWALEIESPLIKR